MNVNEWMTQPVQTIHEDDLLETAAEKMRMGGFRRLPVVDRGGSPIGILSERDIRQHHGYLPVTRVSAAMTEKLITIDTDAPIETAAGLLLKHKIGGLPVVSKNGALTGIITETDLLSGFLQGMGGGEQASSRIDFEFTSEAQTFASAVVAVEKSGGTILGLGTSRFAPDQGGSRSFYLRVCGHDVERIADALRDAHFNVRSVRKGTPE